MDKFDKAILTSIQQDDRLSVGELANKVGMSKSACWRRLQKFEQDGLIKERVALLDPNKLDLSLTTYISVRTNQHNDAWSDEFKRVIESIDGVLEVHRMSGDLDYLIKAVVKDMPGYDLLYKELIKANLTDVSSSFVMETLKQTTQIPIR